MKIEKKVAKLGDIEVDEYVYKEAALSAMEKVAEERTAAVERALGITPENRPSIKDFFCGERIK